MLGYSILAPSLGIYEVILWRFKNIETYTYPDIAERYYKIILGAYCPALVIETYEFACYFL